MVAIRRTASAPYPRASTSWYSSITKSLRRSGISTRARTAARSSSEPEKKEGSVSTEIAEAPAFSYETAIDAGLDGLVLEGTFPERDPLASQVRQLLRKISSAAVVFSVAPWQQLTTAWDILAVSDAVAPGVQELAADAAAPADAPREGE